ncbi:MAG TPA: hypothetical protein VJL58_05370 [Pyrinomonadaceae bacterium]|nr:hypothetical protein [Pyrinomonadaceae bacterium]
MKKLLFLTIAVFAFAAGAFAQKADYSGTWKLDAGKSKLGERTRIESMTLTVTQTDRELKVETATTRLPPPADAPAGPPPGGGGMGRGGMRGFGGGDGTVIYSLDGKETKAEIDGPNGKVPGSYKGSVGSDGSLNLSSSRTFRGQMGEITVTTKETWKLSADGATLTIDRESTSPRGTQTSTLVFTKG